MDDKPEDMDDAFDDLDGLDDLDELDDISDDAELLEDDSWDDFDDELSDEGFEEPAAMPVKKKGFISKNFNLIVIAVAVLGGGGWLYTQMMTPGGNSSPAPAPTDAATFSPVEEPAPADELASGSDLPPMPVPINTPPEDMAAAPAPATADELLTPMPGDAPAPALAPLPEEIADVPGDELAPEPAPVEEATEIVDDMAEATQALADDLSNELQDIITPTEEAPAPEPAPAIEATVKEAVPVDGVEIEAMPVLEEAAPALIAEAPQEDVQPAEDIAPDVSSEELARLESQLQNEATEKQALENQLEAANTKISDMEASMQALEEKLAQLEKQQADSARALKEAQNEAAAAQDMAEKAEAAQKAAAAKTPEPAPQPVVKEEKKQVEETPAPKPAPVAANIEWQLRSAQPGKAILADKNNGDVRNVAVGETIPGLGKITSVAVENDLWVVRGTKGRVSQ